MSHSLIRLGYSHTLAVSDNFETDKCSLTCEIVGSSEDFEDMQSDISASPARKI